MGSRLAVSSLSDHDRPQWLGRAVVRAYRRDRLDTPTETVTARTVEPAGARESNAGDQFHILWAMSRALRLLDPDSQLERLVMEGVSPLDEVAANPSMLLAVDVTEYFGGGGFAEADRVLMSQLKYSYRHPTTAWTASRLAKRPGKGKISVIGRLAETLSAHVLAHGRDAVLEKLRLKLVSNQPASPALTKLLAKVREVLATKATPVQLATLSAGLTKAEATDLAKLHKASGLSQRSFSDLLRVFDIEDLGVGDRADHLRQTVATLSIHVLSDVRGASNDLYVMFLAEATPEKSRSLGITRADLIAELGGSSVESLFPLPPRFTDPPNPIVTDDVRELAASIVGGAARVVAHGVAGVGKTTTLGLLEAELPAGSSVVRYDCFAQGQYLNQAEPRHAPGPGLLQLSNMVAVATGAPLLIRGGDDLAIWQHFERTLGRAAASLPADALLVLAIDAADNAVVAGRIRGTRPFVLDLWDRPLPDGVRLVMTARTQRVDTLEAPASVTTVPLAGFDLDASAAHLRQRFPTADDQRAAEFHERSGGNPRTQFYVLDRSRPDAPTDVDAAVAASALTPETIFEDLVTASTLEAPDPTAAQRHLADLTCMTRPATITTFADVIGVGVSDAERFCAGMAPGLVVEDGLIAFRDEDFETFVRLKVPDGDAAKSHRRIARHLMKVRDVDEYAAAAVAEHMYHGGMFAKLVTLALEDSQPAVISDPVTRIEAYYRRLELAMRVARESEARVDAIPLTLLAAAATASSSAVASVVRKRPDLAMRFADAHSVARIFDDDRGERFKAVQHMRLAGMYADAGDVDLARDQLDFAEAWIRRWSEMSERDRPQDAFQADDVATACRAVRILFGPEAVATEIGRWLPVGFRIEISEALVRDLALSGDLDVGSDILAVPMPPWLRARLLAVADANGTSIPPSVLHNAADEVLSAPPDPRWRGDPWTVEFAETLLRRTQDRDLVRRWLEVFKPPVLPSGPMAWEGLGDWTPLVRHVCLGAALTGSTVTADEVVPASWQTQIDAKAENADRLRDSQKRLTDALNAELPILGVRAQVLARTSGVPQVRAVLDSFTSRLQRRANDFRAPSPLRWMVPLLDAAIASVGNARRVVEAIGSAAAAIDSADHNLTIAVASRVVQSPRYRRYALEWAAQVAEATMAATEPASVRANRMLELSALVHLQDVDAAREYFHAAIDAADGLDDEGAGVLEVHNHLAEGCRGLPAARRRRFAHQLGEAVELYRPSVSDERYLPWARTLAAATALDGPGGLAMLCRWDRADYVRLQSSVASVVQGLADSGFIGPVEGAQLLVAGGANAFDFPKALELLGKALDAHPRPGAAARTRIRAVIDQVAEILCRDATLDDRLSYAHVLSDWAQRRNLSSPALDQVAELAEFVAQLPADPASSRSTYWSASDGQAAKVLECAGSLTLAQIPDALERLLDSWPDGDDIYVFLETAGGAVTAAERVPLLELIADLPAGHRLWRTRGEVVIRWMGVVAASWRARADVRAWASKRFEVVLRERFADLIPYEQAADDSLAAIEGTGLVADVPGLVLASVGPLMSTLSSGQLFAVARSLGRCLDEEERASALEWALSRHAVSDPILRLPDDEPSTVALFLWVLFGHPERAVRWSALHCARALIPDRPELLDRLLAQPDGPDVGAFSLRGAEFLWMSALHTAMVLVSRLAHEDAKLVSPHVDRLIAISTDLTFPHVAIRELARRAVLQLHRSTAATLTETQVERLTFTNVPRSVRIAPRVPRSSTRFAVRHGAKFSFNGLDTMPYWYEPFGRMFDMTSEEVANKAEDWIVGFLGYDQESVRAEVSASRSRYSYGETANDHGSIPRVEDLDTYLEYHAMLLVAGQMLDDNIDLVSSPHDSDWDRWGDWLSGHLNASPEFWVSDLRTRSPLEPWAYGLLPPRERWRERSDDDFLAELGIGDATIVVDAHRQVSCSDRWESTFVSTALVSRTTATALLRALQSCKDPWDFKLPEASLDDPVDDMEIDEAGFRLAGWILDEQVHELGVEEHDPLRRVGLHTVLPGTAFRNYCRAYPDVLGTTLVAASGPVAAMTAFSEEPSLGGTREEPCFGRRTTVDLSMLLGFLDAMKLDLVFEVRIQRQFSRDYGSKKAEEDYERGEHRIYVLRHTGYLETMAGRRRIGRAHR